MNRNLFKWLSVLFAVLGSIGLTFFYAINKKELRPEEVISKASLFFEADLKKFIRNSSISIDKIKTKTNEPDHEVFTRDNLNIFIKQIIEEDIYLKGVVLYNENINYVFYRDKESWITTFNQNNSDSLIDWQRLNNKMEVISEWTDNYNFFTDEDNFVLMHKKLKLENKILWKVAQSKIPDKRDLFFSLVKFSVVGRKPFIAAFMYKISDLESRFSNVLNFKHPLVTIITETNETVSPILTSDTNIIAAYQLLNIEVEKFITNWNNERNKEPSIYSFEKMDNVFWTRIDSIRPQNGVKGFAITVSNNDILTTSQKADNYLLYVSLLSFSIALVFLALFWYSRRKNLVSSHLEPLNQDQILDLIRKGETEFVEFKSSLRWDYRQEKVNNVLEEVILKSIAAFANAKGGILFIGVNDDLEIIGLEPDFNSLKKKDVDYYELHLRKLINNQFSIRFSNTYLLLHFAQFNEKTIAILQIAPSDYPLYLKTKNKQGQQIEKFYVRSGNASNAIELLKEINEYIAIRFAP